MTKLQNMTISRLEAACHRVLESAGVLSEGIEVEDANEYFGTLRRGCKDCAARAACKEEVTGG